MGLDITGLVEMMVQNGNFQELIGNPLAQFGAEGRRYLGTTILPIVPKDENAYTETGIKYRTVLANDGTRYSPVQLKGSTLVGQTEVRVGYSDIGSQFTASDYDALIRILKQSNGNDNLTMEAIARLTNWADAALLLPLIEKDEKRIWDCLVDAQVVRAGDNGYTETVSFPNPSGHRVAAGGNWSNNSYDPYLDIMAAAELLASKGYTAARCFAGKPVISKLSNNDKMKTRTGALSIMSGTVTGMPGRVSKAQLNALLGDDDIPPIEEYNLQYRTQTGTGYFLKRDVFVMIATTGRDESIDLGDSDPFLVRDTLGYTALGTPTGQTGPGRVVKVEAFDRKPPRVEGEAWEASFPVLTEPEAIVVITGIA